MLNSAQQELSDMQLDGGGPVTRPTVDVGVASNSQGHEASMAVSGMAENSTAGTGPSGDVSTIQSGDRPSANAATAGAASRILDELLGDMLTILEEPEDDDRSSSSDVTCASSSSPVSSDVEDTYQNPPQAPSPGPSETEEGELESEDEAKLTEERLSQTRIQEEQREEKRLARQERKKRSIENNVSERDVFRYLKKRGFPAKLLLDFTQACISSNAGSAGSRPAQSLTGSLGDVDGAGAALESGASDSIAGPSKEDIRKLSHKHPYKHLIRRSEKARESREVIGKLLDTCTTIVAEEEALAASAAARQKENMKSTAPLNMSQSEGNHMGRRGVDRSVQTDASVTSATAPSIVPSSAGAHKDTPSEKRIESQPHPRVKTTEIADKAARLASQFNHVLNLKHLNFRGLELRNSTFRPLVPRQPFAPTSHVPGAESAPKPLNGARAPLHPVVNGMNGVSSSSSEGPVQLPGSRDARREAQPLERGRAKKARPMQGATGTVATNGSTVSAPSTSQTASNSTSTDSASLVSAVPIESKSMNDIVPERALSQKHDDPAIPTASNTAPGSTTHNMGQPLLDAPGASSALPPTSQQGKEMKMPVEGADDVASSGATELSDGAHSFVEMLDASHPAPEPALQPATSSTATKGQQPGVRVVRTSMSPPPTKRARQGSGQSPSSTTKSSLPLPPAHLPARPTAPSDQLNVNGSRSSPLPLKSANKSDTLKAMFPKSFHKSTTLPKKPHPYNEVTSTNEAVPIVPKQAKSIDPRMIAAERMKLLREKERESENSGKEGAGRPAQTTSAVSHTTNEQSQENAGVDTFGIQQSTEPSASPASLFGSDGEGEGPATTLAEQPPPPPLAERPASPPPASEARRSANTNIPLPSFKKVGKVSENVSNKAGRITAPEGSSGMGLVDKQRREAELKNKLKRAREENGDTTSSSSSHKRQATEAVSTVNTVATQPRAKRHDVVGEEASKKVDKHTVSAESSKTMPPASRRLVNSIGKRLSDITRPHDLHDTDTDTDTDTDDEDEAVKVTSKRIDKAFPSKGTDKVVPVVEVQTPNSRQGSVASTSSAQEGSVDPQLGASAARRKSAVARKSMGGSRVKPPTVSSAPPAHVKKSTSSSDSSAPAEEDVKVALKLAERFPEDSPAHSGSSKNTSAMVNDLPKKMAPLAQLSRTIIEIDSSDDTDGNQSARQTRKKQSKTQIMASPSPPAASAARPPSSNGKARPKARPLVGSGKQFSDDGLTLSPAKAHGSSAERDGEAQLSQSKPAASRASMGGSIEDAGPKASQRVQTTDPPLASRQDASSLGADRAMSRRGRSSAVDTGAADVQPQMAAVSSPPMSPRGSASPALQDDNADGLMSESASEAYSPSQMPRNSLSPMPEDQPLLPDSRATPVQSKSGTSVLSGILPDHSTDATVTAGEIPVSEATVDVPMPMTQVASSQSPEDSQMLRTASDNGTGSDSDVDMLASDSEDNVYAESLLKGILGELPDLPNNAANSTIHGRTANQAGTQEETTTTSHKEAGTSTSQTENITTTNPGAKDILRMNQPASHKGLMDPMDLSQALRDSEDGDGEEVDEEGAHIEKVKEGNTQASLDQDLQEKIHTAISTARSPTRTASSLESLLLNTSEAEPPMRLNQTISPLPAHNATQVDVPVGEMSRRATATDFMEIQSSTPQTASATVWEGTPLAEASAPPRVGHERAPGDGSTASTDSRGLASPMVPVSEAESYEIIVGQQSPAHSFTANSTNLSSITEHTRATLEALDKPLEEPFTKCRWGIGCLDMDCTFAHASPALPNRWANNGDLPKTRKECADGIRCSDSACIFTHPSPAARRREVCVNQGNCPYGAKCIFRHVDEGSLQLTRPYQNNNQSARFAKAPAVGNSPSRSSRFFTAPPPASASDSTAINAGNKASTRVFPLPPHLPMPPVFGNTSLTSSPHASPAVSNTSNPFGSFVAPNLAGVAYPSTHPFQQYQGNQTPMANSQPFTRTQPEQQHTRVPSANKTWTNLKPAEAISSTAGWLANFTGLGKSTHGPSQ